MKNLGMLVAVVVILAVVAAALLFYNDGSVTGKVVAAVPLEKARTGYFKASYYLPLFVAAEKGFFTAEGLELELVPVENTNQLVEGVVAGRFDFGGGGWNPVFSATAAVPNSFKVFGEAVERQDTGHFQNALLVRADSDIRSPADLKGKKIGTYTGTSQLLWLKLFLPKMGLTPGEDVEIRQVGVPLQVDALAAGQFDALFTVEPTITLAVEKGVGRVLVDNPRGIYVMDPFPAGPLGFFSASYAQKNPQKTAKIRRALENAVDWLNGHESEARQLLVKYISLDSGVASKVRLYSFEKDEQPYQEGVQRLADLLYEGGELKKPIDTSSLWMD